MTVEVHSMTCAGEQRWKVIFVSQVDESLTLDVIKIECSETDGFMKLVLDIISVSIHGTIR